MIMPDLFSNDTCDSEHSISFEKHGSSHTIVALVSNTSTTLKPTSALVAKLNVIDYQHIITIGTAII